MESNHDLKKNFPWLGIYFFNPLYYYNPGGPCAIRLGQLSTNIVQQRQPAVHAGGLVYQLLFLFERHGAVKQHS